MLARIKVHSSKNIRAVFLKLSDIVQNNTMVTNLHYIFFTFLMFFVVHLPLLLSSRTYKDKSFIIHIGDKNVLNI